MSVEDNFTMSDVDADGNVLTFSVIQDESGDTFWAYGHVDPEEFVEELNRWIVHTMGEDECIYSDLAELAQAAVCVDHLWACMDEDRDEIFHVREPSGTEADASTFPVTRLFL